MKIKDLKCKCGSTDVQDISSDFGNTLGIYCKKCGRFIKWASKEERNLIKMAKEVPEQLSNSCFNCAHSKLEPYEEPCNTCTHNATLKNNWAPQ